MKAFPSQDEKEFLPQDEKAYPSQSEKEFPSQSEKVYLSHSEQETRSLAEALAKSARPGQTYCLCGGLGAGKTAFAKGFAEGLGVQDEVVSPTFTLMHEYRGRLPLYHFDIYRLPDEDALYDIGFDEYRDANGICLIEWADQLPEAMPEDAVWIHIEPDPEKGTNYRTITIAEES